MSVDVLDACNLRCKTCMRGRRGMKNSARRMPVDTFRHIVEKAVSDGIANVQLFSWSEPFMLPNLYEYAEIVAESGLHCLLSSHLSFQRIEDLERTLRSVDVLWVSVSGASHETYSINHVGGDLDLVKKNLGEIAELKRRGAIETSVILKHIEFDYNTSDREELASLAEDLGLFFEVFPGWGDPIGGDPDEYAEAFWVDLLENCESPGSSAPPAQGDVCELILGDIALDCDGNVMLCDMVPNYAMFRVGPYLDLSRGEIQLARYEHPMCGPCAWARRQATAAEKRDLLAAFEQKIGWQPTDAEKRDLLAAFEQKIGWSFPAEARALSAATDAARVAELEGLLRAVRDSTSWRVTAPLRRLGDEIRRRRVDR